MGGTATDHILKSVKFARCPKDKTIAKNAVVCSPKSGPLFELVPASDMELNYGQETEA
jgi:hypothetical protein